MDQETTDEELINETAQFWIDLGGDSDKIVYCWHKLRDRIKVLENR